MKIAIAFFGITRSLNFTVKSIEENILSPLSDMGEVRVFGHFFKLAKINNKRSEEFIDISTSHYKLINFDGLIIEDPNLCLSRYDLKKIYSRKDP